MKDIACTAVIVGAGSGTRMGTNEKKQFIRILDIPLIVHTIKNISKSNYFKSCEGTRNS